MQEKMNPDVSGEGVVYSDDLKKGYLEQFLSRQKIGQRKSVNASRELIKALHRIVSILGYDKATIGSYATAIIRWHIDKNQSLLRAIEYESYRGDDYPETAHKTEKTRAYVERYLTADDVNRNGTGSFHLPRELADKLHYYINAINGKKPTVGSYADAIITNHLNSFEGLLSEMLGEKMRNSQ